ERRRDEHRTVETDAGLFLHHPHERPDAAAAVALAGDEDRRVPAVVLREPAGHELTLLLEVALRPEVLVLGLLPVAASSASALVVFLLLLLDDAAEAGADRIDEDEIGEPEPGGLVLDEL